MPPPNQSLRRRAYCKVMVGGHDVTEALDPHLISVQVIDKFPMGDGGADKCYLELDDRDGRLEIPPANLPIVVTLGWAGSGPQIDFPPPTPPGSERQLPWSGSASIVFNGMLTNVESGFARSGGGGRRLWIEADGLDVYGDVKTPMTNSMGVGEPQDTNGSGTATGIGVTGGGSAGGGVPLRDWVNRIGPLAGITQIYISPEIAQIMRDFWFQGRESFMNIIQRLSGEIGFRYKFVGANTLFMVGATEATLADYVGDTVDAWWGVNLISWRIKPFTGRPQFNSAIATWYDSVNGGFKTVERQITTAMQPFYAKAAAALPAMAPNRQVGDQNNEALGEDSVQQRGTGWCILNGEPRARANGTKLNIKGARQGVDGTYMIKEAEHNYIRSGGYTTRCQLDRPEKYETADLAQQRDLSNNPPGPAPSGYEGGTPGYAG